VITLFDLAPSLNAYKIRLLLSLLSLQYQAVPVDVTRGEHRTDEYRKKHPFNLIPVLEDEGEVLWDSQAILFYLARKYGGEKWLPSDPLGEARVVAWLSVAANEVHHGPFLARVGKLFGRTGGVDAALLVARSERLFKVLDDYLAVHPWLVGDHATIADVAVAPGIMHAVDGGLSLAGYAALNRWLADIRRLPGFVDLSGARTRP
jgi:glutathione S-transferase